MSIDSANLNLTIDIDSDPITGSVSVGPNESKPFSGWMELADAIEEARHPVESASEAATGGPPGA